MKSIDYYQNLVTSQYRGKPKFNSWLNVLLQPLIDIGNCADSMHLSFDVDNAVGVQQDILGQILGVSRLLPYQPESGSAVLTDADFRIYLKAKIIQNQWDGKISSLQILWNNLFQNNRIVVIDNQDMSINIAIVGTFSDIIQEMILKGLIVPCPEGVLLNIGIGGGETVSITPPVFGYDEDDAIVSGYGAGYWGGV